MQWESTVHGGRTNSLTFFGINSLIPLIFILPPPKKINKAWQRSIKVFIRSLILFAYSITLLSPEKSTSNTYLYLDVSIDRTENNTTHHAVILWVSDSPSENSICGTFVDKVYLSSRVLILLLYYNKIVVQRQLIIAMVWLLGVNNAISTPGWLFYPPHCGLLSCR